MKTRVDDMYSPPTLEEFNYEDLPDLIKVSVTDSIYAQICGYLQEITYHREIPPQVINLIVVYTNKTFDGGKFIDPEKLITHYCQGFRNNATVINSFLNGFMSTPDKDSITAFADVVVDCSQYIKDYLDQKYPQT